MLAEHFRSTAELAIGAGAARNAREVTNQAYNLSVGYVLTGEDSSFRGVTPRTNFNPSKGTWGAFEIVARLAHVDIGDEAFFDPAGAGVSLASANNATENTSYGLGLNWYLSRSVRAAINVFQSDFTLPAANTVAPAGSALSDDETAVITRLQVSF